VYISDSAIPPSKRSFIHTQEEELSFDNASSPPDDQTPHPPHTTISSVSAKTMPSPHLPLGELMVKKPRREVQTGTPVTQFRGAKKNIITQLSLNDLDRINTPVQTSVLLRFLLKGAERFRENEIRLRYESDLAKQPAADNYREAESAKARLNDLLHHKQFQRHPLSSLMTLISRRYMILFANLRGRICRRTHHHRSPTSLMSTTTSTNDIKRRWPVYGLKLRTYNSHREVSTKQLHPLIRIRR